MKSSSAFVSCRRRRSGRWQCRDQRCRKWEWEWSEDADDARRRNKGGGEGEGERGQSLARFFDFLQVLGRELFIYLTL